MTLTTESLARHKVRRVATQQKLLDAALQLFVERGFGATTTADLAERAGVAKGTLYLYYKSKDELLQSVITEYLTSVVSAAADRVRRHEGDMASLLQEVLTECWQQVYDSSGSAVIKLIVSEGRNFPELASFYKQEVIDPGQRIIAGILERGIASGEFRPVNVTNAVESLLFPMVLLCIDKHSLMAAEERLAPIDFRSFAHSHVGLLLNGMLNVAASPRD